MMPAVVDHDVTFFGDVGLRIHCQTHSRSVTVMVEPTGRLVPLVP
jgi:hypothetical protein